MSFMGNRPTRRNYGKMRSAVANVARERIEILLRQAEEVFPQDVEFSKRYTGLAKKISKRTKVRIPQEKKRFLCKNCGQPLVPGKNAQNTFRRHISNIIISCFVWRTTR